MTTPVLRPLSTGELLDRTFALYRGHFKLFVGIAAVTNVAIVCLQLAGLAIRSPQQASSPGCGVALLWVVAVLIVSLGVAAACQGATIVAVSHVYLGREITVRGAIEHIRGRITGLVVTMIVLGIGVALGLLLLIVPGLVLALMWALAIPVAVLEQRTMLDAAGRSKELTEGSRLRVLLIYILFALAVLIIDVLITAPITITALVTAGRTGTEASIGLQVANLIAQYIAGCLTAPIMTIGLSLLYYDQRVRKEAFDLDVMMEAIDGQAGGSAVPAV